MDWSIHQGEEDVDRLFQSKIFHVEHFLRRWYGLLSLLPFGLLVQGTGHWKVESSR